VCQGPQSSPVDGWRTAAKIKGLPSAVVGPPRARTLHSPAPGKITVAHPTSSTLAHLPRPPTVRLRAVAWISPYRWAFCAMLTVACGQRPVPDHVEAGRDVAPDGAGDALGCAGDATSEQMVLTCGAPEAGRDADAGVPSDPDVAADEEGGPTDVGAIDSGATDGKVSCDAPCVVPFPRCGPRGSCVMCLTDDDCAGEFCDPIDNRCEGCRSDADCPAARPACVRDWEYHRAFCARCRVGSPDHCPAGQWCRPPNPIFTDGQCTPHRCATDPVGSECMKCRDVNTLPCVETGAPCASVMVILRQCYEASAPGGSCYLLRAADRHACVPDVCKPAVEAVDACLQNCAAANFPCR
jgi:hypothetical protein